MYSGAYLNTGDAEGSSIKIGEHEVDILLLYILYQGLCDKEIMVVIFIHCEKPDAQEPPHWRSYVLTDMIVSVLQSPALGTHTQYPPSTHPYPWIMGGYGHAQPVGGWVWVVQTPLRKSWVGNGWSNLPTRIHHCTPFLQVSCIL